MKFHKVKRREADLGDEIRCEHVDCPSPAKPPALPARRALSNVAVERRSRSRLTMTGRSHQQRRTRTGPDTQFVEPMKNKDVGPLVQTAGEDAIEVTECT